MLERKCNISLAIAVGTLKKGKKYLKEETKNAVLLLICCLNVNKKIKNTLNFVPAVVVLQPFTGFIVSFERSAQLEFQNGMKWL